LPKTNLDQWRDAYIQAAKQIKDSKNTEKALSEIIKQAQELNEFSEDDKKDYFKVLSEMIDINKGDLDSAKAKVQDLIDNKPIK
jgi:argininosuccinate lyase